MIMNTLIGVIAISIAVLILYAIGRIVVCIIAPDTHNPDLETTWTAAALGGIFLCILCVIVCVCSILGEAIVRALQ
jgi:hypothetical protein